MSTRGQPDASLRSRHLNCPRCGLSIAVRPHRAAIRHCPRCVARSRVIVELFTSTLPADVLYAENSLPRADAEVLVIASTPPSGGRHDRTQVADKFRPVQRRALVVTRPMAVSPSAIDERAASHRSRPRLATCSRAARAGRTYPRIRHLTQGMAIPRRHQGMELAYALLTERERIGTVKPPSADAFPGWENEMQGVTPGQDSSGRPYRGVYCLTES